MRITTFTTRFDKDKLPCLVKEKSVNYSTDFTALDNTKKIVQIMTDLFAIHTMAEEYVYVISMSAKCRVLAVFELSHGTIDTSAVGMRELYIKLLLSGAVNFVVVHNHPSGIAIPSEEDMLCTRRIKESAKLLGLHFVDHIIIGDAENYYSFAETNVL